MKTYDPKKLQLWVDGHRRDLIYYSDNNRHLVCVPYSVQNLHDMAQGLGIKRCWYHGGRHPHYDIPQTRVAEIQAKTCVVPSRMILRIIKGHNPKGFNVK